MTLPRAYWRWSAEVQLARLPATMAPLAFTLLATAITGSYRLGGVLMAVFVVAELLGAVPAGRLLDRSGTARGLTLLDSPSARSPRRPGRDCPDRSCSCWARCPAPSRAG
jgi:hypothetical protein